MDTGEMGTDEQDAARPVDAASAASAGVSPLPRRIRLGADLALLAVVGVVLIAALGATVNVLYREFYSPSAFVGRYLSLLSDGRAADALEVPGVQVDSSMLEAAGLAPTASEALLRRDALTQLSDIRIESEETYEDLTRVTAGFTASGHRGSIAFDIERDGTIGIAPTWRFARSPLAVMNLQVGGSMQFTVNGFEIDKRQVSPDRENADPVAPVSLLVFSPGLYSVSVDTAISATPGVAVLADAPFHAIPVEVQATATSQFVEVVQQRVEEFLTACATQQVLQPTGCPFGHFIQDRIASDPVWSIVQQPTVTVEPDGAGWRIPPAQAVAHIEVEVRSLFDGRITDVSEDVPFAVGGVIAILPDGRATITVGTPGGDTQ